MHTQKKGGQGREREEGSVFLIVSKRIAQTAHFSPLLFAFYVNSFQMATPKTKPKSKKIPKEKLDPDEEPLTLEEQNMLLQRQLESTKYQLSTSRSAREVRMLFCPAVSHVDCLVRCTTTVGIPPNTCFFSTTTLPLILACARMTVTLQQKHDSAETVVRAQRNELEDLHRVILAEKKVRRRYVSRTRMLVS